MADKSRYDDELAQTIYVGRLKEAFGKAWVNRPQWPADQTARTTLEHHGGNAEMDLAIASAKEVRGETDKILVGKSQVERLKKAGALIAAARGNATGDGG